MSSNFRIVIPRDISGSGSINDLTSNADKLLQIVKREKDLFIDKDPSRIVMGGFQEGAVVALAAFAKYKNERRLGGVFSMSGIHGLPIVDLSDA